MQEREYVILFNGASLTKTFERRNPITGANRVALHGGEIKRLLAYCYYKCILILREVYKTFSNTDIELYFVLNCIPH